MKSAQHNIDKSEVISFVGAPALLLYFGEYVLAKQKIAERFAIEENDENIDTIFLLLLIKAFVEFKKGSTCPVSQVMLGCVQEDKTKAKPFFKGKDAYISKHLLSDIAKEFFLSGGSTEEQRKYTQFIDFFEDIAKDTSRFLAVLETKKVVISIYLGVLVELSKRQSPEAVIEKHDTSEAMKKLNEFYDAIDGELSFEEFYFFHKYCILRGLSPIVLPVRIRDIAKSIPLLGCLITYIERAVLWFRNFT